VAQLDAEKEALMQRAAASQQTCAQMVVQLKAARERWHKTCLTNVALCKARARPPRAPARRRRRPGTEAGRGAVACLYRRESSPADLAALLVQWFSSGSAQLHVLLVRCLPAL